MSRFQWLALATACATFAVISPVSVAAEAVSLGTEEICKFPFLYKGSWWNTCTSIGSEKPWCILKPENKPPPPANDWLTCDDSLSNITALVEGSQEPCVTRDVNGEKVFGCSSNGESGPFTCLTKSGKTGTCTKRKLAGKASASPNSNVVASSVPNSDNNSSSGKSSSKPDAGAIAASVAGVGALALVAGLFIYRRRQSSRTVDWQKGELKNSGNPGGPVPPAAAAAAAAVGHRDSTASSQMFSPVSPGERLYSVISTYTPTLGDELEIQPGDKVGILIEYDDGWCQGINHTRGGLKGVFPKHCVDMSSGSSADSSMRLSVGARNSQLGL